MFCEESVCCYSDMVCREDRGGWRVERMVDSVFVMMVVVVLAVVSVIVFLLLGAFLMFMVFSYVLYV